MSDNFQQVRYTRKLRFKQSPTTATAEFRSGDATQTVSDIFTLNEVDTFLPSVDGLDIAADTVRIDFGGRKYFDEGGVLYAQFDPKNNTKVAAGSIDYGTNTAKITDWSGGPSGAPELAGGMVKADPEPLGSIVFRTPIAPLQTGSFQLFFTLKDDAQTKVRVTPNEQNQLRGDNGQNYGYLDEYSGVASVNFNEPVDPESIRYNAVAFTYLPLDSELIGLDTVRLPVDGRVPFVRKGDSVSLIEAKAYELPTLNAGDVHAVGDVRLSDLTVKDANGAAVPTDSISVDLDAGTVTLGAAFDAANYDAPLTAYYHIMDVALATAVDISGRVTLSQPITHDYSTNAVLSSLCITGDQQARAFGVFSQKSWTGVWQDSLIGDAAESQYQTANNPIEVVNKHAIKERWALIFNSGTSFRIVGEAVGEIGTGQTGVDVAPLNPATGQPYFKILASGWGQGWDAGNVLRFNTDAPKPAFWIGSAIMQHQVGQQDAYKFELAIHANVDREESQP